MIDPEKEELERRRKAAICRFCPLFRAPACCGCPEARERPWIELNGCRHGRWDLTAPAAGLSSGKPDGVNNERNSDDPA